LGGNDLTKTTEGQNQDESVYFFHSIKVDFGLKILQIAVWKTAFGLIGLKLG
jgi:hypothetical protein